MDQKKWQEILNRATEKTDSQFASEISSLSKLTDKQIDEIVPQIMDKENLEKILLIVRDKTKDNNQKAEAIKNIEGAAEIIKTLLPYLDFNI
ncbi:MAG: hypothetical protein Q8933_20310 [Bacteroidota bacterium]|nr:hypothetical protein [Bacteroidota bacterium]